MATKHTSSKIDPAFGEALSAAVEKNAPTIEFDKDGNLVHSDVSLEQRSAGWDAAAAVGRLRAWAGVDAEKPDAAAWKKYGEAFGWKDPEKSDTLGGYKLPVYDVEDGKLVLSRGGLLAAGAALQGSRGGVDLPAGDAEKVKAHFGKLYKEFDLVAPWDREEEEKRMSAQRGPIEATKNAPAATDPGAPVTAPAPGQTGVQPASTIKMDDRPSGAGPRIEAGIGGVQNASGQVPVARADGSSDAARAAYFPHAMKAQRLSDEAEAISADDHTKALVAHKKAAEAHRKAAEMAADGMPKAVAKGHNDSAADHDKQADDHEAKGGKVVAEQRAVERITRSMFGLSKCGSPCLDSDEPVRFADAYSQAEKQEELNEALWVLRDVLEICTVGSHKFFPTPQAMVDFIGEQLNAYMATVVKIVETGATAEDPMAALSASGSFTDYLRRDIVAASEAAREVVSRAGAKYSGETKDKLKAIHDALSQAHEVTSKIMSEIEPQESAMADPITTPPAGKSETPPAAEPLASGAKAPGTAGDASVAPGTTQDAGPGKAGSDPGPGAEISPEANAMLAEMRECMKGMAARLDALDKSEKPADGKKLEEKKPDTEQRSTPVDPITEMVREVRDTVKAMDGRLVKIEQRRQGAAGAGDPPPPVRGEQRSGSGWGEGVLSGALKPGTLSKVGGRR